MRALLIACLLGAAVAQAPAPETAPAPRPEPAGRSVLAAAETLPARAPHVAVGADGCVAVAFASEDEIRCALSHDAGATFGGAQRVGSAGKLSAGPSRGPRAAVTEDVVAVLAICGEKGGGADGDVLAWRSEDRGASWKGPVRVNDVRGAAREGLHALAAAPDGTLLAVWIDLRHEGAEVWGDWSRDGGATWEGDRVLYAAPGGSICPCCGPSASFDAVDGRALVMWRNVIDGARDPWLLSMRATDPSPASAAKPAGTGHWRLNACPMAGGGLASRGGELLSFWRREGTLFVSAPGKEEREVGPGREAVVTAAPGGFRLAWTDAEGRVLTAPAAAPGPVSDSRVLGRGLNVSVGGAPDGAGPVVAAWETGAGGADSLRYEVLAPREPAGP